MIWWHARSCHVNVYDPKTTSNAPLQKCQSLPLLPCVVLLCVDRLKSQRGFVNNDSLVIDFESRKVRHSFCFHRCCSVLELCSRCRSTLRNWSKKSTSSGTGSCSCPLNPKRQRSPRQSNRCFFGVKNLLDGVNDVLCFEPLIAFTCSTNEFLVVKRASKFRAKRMSR